jgi:hypothetical protein
MDRVEKGGRVSLETIRKAGGFGKRQSVVYSMHDGASRPNPNIRRVSETVSKIRKIGGAGCEHLAKSIKMKGTLEDGD